MSLVWGEFQDMAIFYLKELAKRGSETPMLFSATEELVYGVCTLEDFGKLVGSKGLGMYRPVCAASSDEFMALLLARFMDFSEEESDDNEKKDISAGEQSSRQPTSVDARGDQGTEGGRSENPSGQREKDNDRTVH